MTGTYGTFSFTRDNAAGTLQWTYTLDNSNAAVQALRDGQVAYDKLAVKVADDGGATSDVEVITVTITGANDDPTLTNVLAAIISMMPIPTRWWAVISGSMIPITVRKLKAAAVGRLRDPRRHGQ